MWAYGTYILMTTVIYRDTIPIFRDWRHYQRPVERLKRQRLSFCDDQDCRFSGDYRVPMLAVWLGRGNKGAGVYQFPWG